MFFPRVLVGTILAFGATSASAAITHDKKIHLAYIGNTASVPKRPALNRASATVLITDDNGGKIGDYLNAFASVRESGKLVIINGPCYSACTLILGVVPRDRVCAISSAKFGFHAARKMDSSGRPVSSPEGTNLLWNTYPEDVRRWITDRGGLSVQMIVLEGPELRGIVRLCRSHNT